VKCHESCSISYRPAVSLVIAVVSVQCGAAVTLGAVFGLYLSGIYARMSAILTLT
jgi:hypothetical protein